MTDTVNKWGIAVEWKDGWELAGYNDGSKTFKTKREATEYWKNEIKPSLAPVKVRSKVVRVHVTYSFEA